MPFSSINITKNLYLCHRNKLLHMPDLIDYHAND